MILYVLIGLFSFSILLFILSLFKRDKVKDLEEQVEQLSLTIMQENYQMKKRIKILEEELLFHDEELHNTFKK
ncbi:hypothetical protein [Bacillus pinisoli]|uniref:hypothetical protein n=1 Tax=Bacillus pinisoli TaxID=2901866 RepID=UPI001FF67908|nr:hypothetical protein [Bacillus pinisoli]